MRNIILCIALILIVLLAGCQAQQTITAPTPVQSTIEAGAAAKSIEISNFAFNPEEINVKVGDTITWTNMDSAMHRLASTSGNEIMSDNLQKGQSYSHKFYTAGTFEYECSLHPSMKGKIIVE
jgi:amicyanin